MNGHSKAFWRGYDARVDAMTVEQARTALKREARLRRKANVKALKLQEQIDNPLISIDFGEVCVPVSESLYEQFGLDWAVGQAEELAAVFGLGTG